VNGRKIMLIFVKVAKLKLVVPNIVKRVTDEKLYAWQKFVS
jgi:hypothetical protein